MKADVFFERPTSTAERKAKLSEVIFSTDKTTLPNVFENIKTRLGFVFRQGNSHSELLFT